jgi:hypothetical protein
MGDAQALPARHSQSLIQVFSSERTFFFVAGLTGEYRRRLLGGADGRRTRLGR